MAGLGDVDIKVTVTFEAVQDSPELQGLLRELIKQELANLTPEMIQALTTQIIDQYEVRE